MTLQVAVAIGAGQQRGVLGLQLSGRAQVIMLWWALAFMAVFGVAWWGLLGMMPVPPATLGVAEVARLYQEHSLRMRLGAVIASWTSAFMVPFSVVVSVQLARLERGFPIWSVLQFAGGILMSLFLVVPPILWGVAAFSPARPPEITAMVHELAILILVTTDQYFIFQMVAIAYVSLTQSVDARSPFPRWIGYFTIWAAFMFEIGAVAFVPRQGPFSWNGLFVFWCPLVIFGCWVTVVAVSILRAIRVQGSDR